MVIPYGIKLVLCRKLHLVLGKSTKTAAITAALFNSNMYQIVCRLEFRLGPTGGNLQHSPDSLLYLGRLLLKRGEEKRVKSKRGEGGEGEFVLCPRKKKLGAYGYCNYVSQEQEQEQESKSQLCSHGMNFR